MAKLSPFFGPHDGKLRIFVKVFSVGSRTFKSFEDFRAAFGGSFKAFGQSGTFDLSIRLSDGDTSAKSGPCELALNDKTDNNATYQVSGKKLTLTTKLNDTPIEFFPAQGGTQVNGVSGHNLWIGP